MKAVGLCEHRDFVKTRSMGALVSKLQRRQRDILGRFVLQDDASSYICGCPFCRSPISALPVELVEKILNEAAILEAEPFPKNIYIVYRSLAGVCRQWKQVLEGAHFQRIFIAQWDYLASPNLVHVIPKGEAVHGVTCLGGDVFVVRQSTPKVEDYDVTTFALLRCLPVPGLCWPHDVKSREGNNSLYIADHIGNCVFRVTLTGDVTQFPVGNAPSTLHVTASGSVIVTFYSTTLKEFAPDGQLLRELTYNFQINIAVPRHTIQLPSGQLVVSHVGQQHRVCLTDDAGRLVQSFGGNRGSTNEEVNWPDHLAVDRKGYVLVADSDNDRVVLLSPTLTFVANLVSSHRGLLAPWRLCLDEKRGILFVGELRGGRVLIFKIRISKKKL